MAYKISNTLKPCHVLCQNLGKTHSFTVAHPLSPTFASLSSVQPRPCAINAPLHAQTCAYEGALNSPHQSQTHHTRSIPCAYSFRIFFDLDQRFTGSGFQDSSSLLCFSQ